MNAITNLFQRMTVRGQEKSDATTDDIRTGLVIFGENKLGRNGDVDIDHYLALFESNGFSKADISINVDAFIEAVRQADLASQVDTLLEDAEAKQRKHIDFDVLFGKQIRDGKKKLIELEQDSHAADIRYQTAMAAKSNLIAGAQVTDAERNLIAEQSKVGSEVSRLKIATDPGFASTDHRGFSTGLGGNWASIETHPALLAEQTRRELKNEKVSLPAEKKAQLKSQLVFAECAVSDRTRELKTSEKELAALNTRLAKFAADKLLPENFRIVRAKPSRIESQKQHAAKFGFFPEK